MKKICLLFLGMVLGMVSAHSQRKLELRLKYSQDFRRFEVLAKSNFSQEKFLWGPSQISIVVPSNSFIKRVAVHSLEGGVWDNNSVVIAPEIMPEAAFHGFDTKGDISSIRNGEESVLFYFTLPESIDPTKVRLYDNDNDPDSKARGMKGGDFSNCIYDITTEDLFGGVYGDENVEVNPPIDSITKEILDAKVYPNVIENDQVSVELFGDIEDQDEVMLLIYDDAGKELLRKETTRSGIQSRKLELPATAAGKTLNLRFLTPKGNLTKRIINE